MADNGVQSFLPWARQGLVALPPDAIGPGLPGAPGLPGVARTLVQLQVSGGPPIQQQLRLYGPGDVVGIAPGHVIRTEPADLTSNFESNFLAAVEFDRPDFPWLFTPASPNANRLRPWLCLVVVRQQDGVNILGGSDRPLPVLEIRTPARAAAELPNLGESWAWAHAQVSGQITAQLPLSQIEAGFPERTASRLLCPRRLEPDTAYHACLVPAFQAGVKTGLGLPLTDDDLKTLQPAWQPAATSALLPVYFRWQFRTGAAGDFASLAQKITVFEFDKGSGVRGMDVSAAGLHLPTAPAGSPDAIVGLEGALVPPKTAPAAWNNAFSTRFRKALQGLLGVPNDSAADPIVGPPLYAGRHANQLRPLADTATPLWLRELNLHPGYRTVAGWGTRVVERQQEALMASAWDQVGEIERVNNLLRHGQLVRAAARAVFERDFSKLFPGPLLDISRPVHARIAVAPQTTVQKLLAMNKLPIAIVTPEFRKMARPRGPLLRAVLPPDQRVVRQLASKVAARVVVFGIPRPLGPTITPELVEQRFQSGGGTRPAGAPAVTFRTLQTTPMESVSTRPFFFIRRPEFTPPPFTIVESATELPDNAVAARYRAAISAHQKLLGPLPIIDPLHVPDLPTEALTSTGLAQPTVVAQLHPETGGSGPSATVDASPPATLTLDAVQTMLLAQLHPDVAVSGFVRNLATVDGQPAAGDDLEPVAAAPSFPQPMYAAAARPRARHAAARAWPSCRRQGRAPRRPTPLRRGLHGRPQPRDGARAALARVTRPTSAAPTSGSSGIPPAAPPHRPGTPAKAMFRRSTPGRGRSTWERSPPAAGALWSSSSRRSCCAAIPTRSSTPCQPSSRPARPGPGWEPGRSTRSFAAASTPTQRSSVFR